MTVRRAADLEGRRFGRLLVVSRNGSDARGNSRWSCLCDCGKTSTVLGQSLKRGATSSCGCLASEIVGNQARTHGASGTAAYKAWHAMLQRCSNEAHHKWHRYGGRGITVCERWHSYEMFLADMGPRPKGMSIDRKNNDGNYEPGNCRWATPAEQAANRSTNLIVSVGGRGITASEASRGLGKNSSTVSRRIREGWPIEAATQTPLNSRRK